MSTCIVLHSNPLNVQAVKCLGQFYITLQTVQSLQYKFSTKDNRKQNYFPVFSCLAFSASPI